MFGSDRMLLESVIAFVSTGARVVVALPGAGPLVAELRSAGAEVVILPMLVLRKTLLTPRGLPRLFRDVFRGLGAAWRLIGRVRPDVVYVSTIIVPQWPLLARLRGARAVSHVHEAEASGRRIVNTVLYAPHLASHLTIANSRFTLETMRAALPALARRSTVVYNGVASTDHPTEPREAIDGPLRVLYIGRLSPRKGPDLIVDAAALLVDRGVDVSVTLVGAVFEGYEWFEEQLRAQASAAGIDVDFAGFQADVWSWIAGADVLVLPSRGDESLGNSAVEGILGRRPVIASDSSGLREAAGGYATAQLIPVDDAPALADALERVRDDWESIVPAVDAARTEALRRHAPESYRAAIGRAVLGG